MDTLSISETILKMLRDATPKNPVHWSVFTEELVEKKLCTNDELVAAVNTLVRPVGRVVGMNHNFWIDK